MPSVLVRDRKDRNTEKRPCEGGGRGWSYEATSQGMPGATTTGTSKNSSFPKARGGSTALLTS